MVYNTARSGRRLNFLMFALVTAAALLTSCGSVPAPTPNAANVAHSNKPRVETAASSPKRFNGGDYESSGVAFVPGTDQVLFVDDTHSKEIFAMSVDANGDQAGDVIKVPLGAQVEDAEDITFDGTYYYVIGSGFRKKSDKTASLVRLKYDPVQHAATSEAVSGLITLLISSFPELAKATSGDRSENSLNIEGIAWDPNRKWLLLGLRSPEANGNALVLPIKLKDANGPFTIDNIEAAQPNAFSLPLDGLAVRSIEYDQKLGAFLIIAGAMEGEKKADFYLWQWNGTDAPRKLGVLDKKVKPEGITRVTRNGEDILFLVGDAGFYFKYPDPPQQ